MLKHTRIAETKTFTVLTSYETKPHVLDDLDRLRRKNQKLLKEKVISPSYENLKRNFKTALCGAVQNGYFRGGEW